MTKKPARKARKTGNPARQTAKARPQPTAAAIPLPAVPAAVAPDVVPLTPAGRPDWRVIVRTRRFRAAGGFLALGFVLFAFSQAIPHDYGFLELGGLFTLSVYDLVLAMLGLSVAAAIAETMRQFRAIVLTFLGVLAVMLMFFDSLFALILLTPLGDNLFLVAPSAVILTGASLWLPGRWRQRAVTVSAGLVGFSFALFIGLDDLGVGIVRFAFGAVAEALWVILAPAFLLRQFRGPWLTIPLRIVGSWLVVIGVIVMVSLYLPMKQADAPPLPATGEPLMILPNGEQVPLVLPEDEPEM
ncbi:hypothetical protein HGO38_24435 [Rhizobium sp. CG5]|uniref:hypothetical protein n=1 Tax=Rhizobium sp. CG5 TaxID=2726076 RepID=UPI0020333163|nr:hypothetical protein [Rhizobium sp. CG5]MCM2476598.1 hypothetical protein [Rhizobium sp. CG5]